MQRIIFISLLCAVFGVHSQTTTKEGVLFQIKKTKPVDKQGLFRFSQVKITNNDFSKVLIKVKIKANPENKAKLSSLSLLDIKNKIRYRLSDFVGYACPVGCLAYSPAYRKSEIMDKKGKPITYGPPIDKSVKDYFYDYDMDGFSNMEIPINFGKKDNPKLSIVYFGEASSKNLIGELYFGIPTKNLKSDYELYYKDEKVADIKF